ACRKGEAMLAGLRLASAGEAERTASFCADPSNRLAAQLRAIARYLRDPRPEHAAVLDENLSTAKKGWSDFAAAGRAAAEARKLAVAVAAADGGLMETVLDLLAGFARAFRKTYTAEGSVSFDGLLAHVRSLLLSQDFPEIRERLKAK